MNPNMFTLRLTADQFEWLQTFLERTEIKGKEVPFFISIVNAIREAGTPPEDRVIPQMATPHAAPSKPA